MALAKVQNRWPLSHEGFIAREVISFKLKPAATNDDSGTPAKQGAAVRLIVTFMITAPHV